MCGGGGGSDDGGYAARQAQTKAEQDAAIARVNNVFGKGTGAESPANLAGREQLYSTIGADSEARLLDTLGTDRTKAERNVRMQLARQGLMGGSADIDQGSELLEQFQKGSLEARNAATGASNSARANDEKTRVNLINNVRSGMAETDALSAAYAGLNNNANEARDAAMATDIGGFFNDLGILNNQIAYQKGVTNTTGRYAQPGIVSPASSGGFGGRITG